MNIEQFNNFFISNLDKCSFLSVDGVQVFDDSSEVKKEIIALNSFVLFEKVKEYGIIVIDEKRFKFTKNEDVYKVEEFKSLKNIPYDIFEMIGRFVNKKELSSLQKVFNRKLVVNYNYTLDEIYKNNMIDQLFSNINFNIEYKNDLDLKVLKTLSISMKYNPNVDLSNVITLKCLILFDDIGTLIFPPNINEICFFGNYKNYDLNELKYLNSLTISSYNDLLNLDINLFKNITKFTLSGNINLDIPNDIDSLDIHNLRVGSNVTFNGVNKLYIKYVTPELHKKMIKQIEVDEIRNNDVLPPLLENLKIHYYTHQNFDFLNLVNLKTLTIFHDLNHQLPQGLENLSCDNILSSIQNLVNLKTLNAISISKENLMALKSIVYVTIDKIGDIQIDITQFKNLQYFLSEKLIYKKDGN
jgi:hypothetical protein